MPRTLALVLVPVLIVAAVATLAAALEHEACFHPGPPVTRPEPSTARGEYCDAVNSATPWLSLTLGPVLLIAALAYLARRSPTVVAALTLAVCVLLLANAAVANSLAYSLTI